MHKRITVVLDLKEDCLDRIQRRKMQEEDRKSSRQGDTSTHKTYKRNSREARGLCTNIDCPQRVLINRKYLKTTYPIRD